MNTDKRTTSICRPILIYDGNRSPGDCPTNMPALARRRADAVNSIGPMLAKHSGPASFAQWRSITLYAVTTPLCARYT